MSVTESRARGVDGRVDEVRYVSTRCFRRLDLGTVCPSCGGTVTSMPKRLTLCKNFNPSASSTESSRGIPYERRYRSNAMEKQTPPRPTSSHLGRPVLDAGTHRRS